MPEPHHPHIARHIAQAISHLQQARNCLHPWLPEPDPKAVDYLLLASTHTTIAIRRSRVLSDGQLDARLDMSN